MKRLKRWFDENDLWSSPEALLFPSFHRQSKKSVSHGWLRKAIKKAMVSIGYNPTRYSGHSLRAGGATDLFNSGMPYYLIKKAGRWKSDAAMMYYRDAAEVSKAVMSAFSKIFLSQ